MKGTIARRTVLALALTALSLAAGCSAGPQPPDGALTVDALMADPVYDVEVAVYGQVSLLGELFCPCFELSSGGQTLEVWYDLMTYDDGATWPPVRVDGIANGDWVTVTGELKTAGQHRGENDFWARAIERAG
jgi:hypothetical protein